MTFIDPKAPKGCLPPLILRKGSFMTELMGSVARGIDGHESRAGVLENKHI